MCLIKETFLYIQKNMRIQNGWVTHDNGDYDLEIVKQEELNNVWRVKSRETGEETTVELEWVHPSTIKPLFNGDDLSELEIEWWEGYSVLAKFLDQPNTYLVLARNTSLILELEDDEELLFDEIISSSVSNDVWYTVLFTNKRTYLAELGLKIDVIYTREEIQACFDMSSEGGQFPCSCPYAHESGSNVESFGEELFP